MVNAYTRGAVEVLYAGAVEVRSRYARGAVEVYTLVVRSRYARGAVEVRSWYGPSTVEVRSWCASGSVRLVNFSTGDTVHVHTPETTTVTLSAHARRGLMSTHVQHVQCLHWK